ncbi:MAG: diguanylate cyclase [Spirochaetales bacterium]|nr:diguanylate cyclase [Spirochaetales bacterium]
MKKKRYTIGFIFGDFYGAYTANLFYNIVKTCREYDQNILGFGGGFLASPDQSVLGENCNFIYDLVNKENVDGIIIEGSIGNFISRKMMLDFLKKYAGIPMVNIGTNIEGINNILIDNKKGMEDLVTHLVEYHNYKKIAFVEGTEGNFEAIARYKAYEKVLKQHNIPIDKNLVTNGNFNYFGGVKAYQTLFEERKADIDAIVCANDYMAISIILEMQKHGYKVPDDAAVTGFDDTEESLTTKPTLTTIKQPFYDIGQESVKMLLSLLEGKKVPDKIVLPTEFLIRESCGCKVADKLYHIKSSGITKTVTKDDKNECIDEISININKELPFLINKISVKQWVKDIIDSYNTINGGENRDRLFERFLILFHKLIDSNEEILTIYRFISIFYSSIINRLTVENERENVLHLWIDTVILFGLLIKDELSDKKAKFKLESHVVFDINENFINTFNFEQLKEAILDNLTHFQFNSFFICLFEDETLEKSKILIAYDKNKREKIRFDSFPSKNLLPSKINKNKRFEYVVMSLNFKDEYFGYVIYDIQTLTCFIYETLSVQISGAIKGSRLTNELYEYTTQLETKVKERTIELENANEKLKKLDELKNDFIANITHDFRSPLTSILNVAELALKYDKKIDDENKENYSLIFQASLRLKNSIDKLLDIAKMDAHGIKLKIKKLDLISFITRILDFYSSSVLGSDIKIIRKLPGKKISNFYTDIEKLEEIIDNIMSNAIKFRNPKKGIITCELKEKNNTALICISDNGIGIKKEKLETIFNRFEQAHNGRNSPYRGTGIGLAFAKQLVGYLKGNIWAESDGEGKGSKFFIEFKKGKEIFDKKDFYDEENTHIKKKDVKALVELEIGTRESEEKIVTYFTDLNRENEADYKKAIIIIIDDDKNVREIVIKYLKNYGYRNFIAAADGKSGLEAVYEYSPDLILCDYNMPNMKGDEFHNELISNPKYKKIPFVFLSAIADKDLIIERRQKGANAYLKKPIDEKILILTVEENIKKYFEYLKISKLATIDELTGLKNKRAIIENLRRELATRKYRDMSLIFMDLDSFKIINDDYGHQVGDKLLSSIGELLKSSMRHYDIIGRYGGDEFVLILPDTDMKQAFNVTKILSKSLLNNKLIHNEKEIAISSSFGVASLKDNAKYIEKTLKIANLKDIYEVDNAAEADWQKIENIKFQISELLLKMADTALYKAKQTECKKCGFVSKKSHDFLNDRCSKCKSDELIKGRNKVITFKP